MASVAFAAGMTQWKAIKVALARRECGVKYPQAGRRRDGGWQSCCKRLAVLQQTSAGLLPSASSPSTHKPISAAQPSAGAAAAACPTRQRAVLPTRDFSCTPPSFAHPRTPTVAANPSAAACRCMQRATVRRRSSSIAHSALTRTPWWVLGGQPPGRCAALSLRCSLQ